VGSSLLARSRALAGCACVALAVAGCAAAASNSPIVTGRTLTIYMSTPPSLAADPQATDVLYAERLAFTQHRGDVTAYRVRLGFLNHNLVSENARQAITDTSVIAYVGEVPPGASAASLGITNAQDVLQVSATDTAAELTQKTPAVPGAPQRYYESLSTYGRTFARVVPNTFLEARALVTQMQSAGLHTVYIAGDGSEYGRTLGLSVRNAAASAGISIASSATGAGGVLFAGSAQAQATQAFNQAAAASPRVKLYAPSALDDDAFLRLLSPAAQANLNVSAAGLLPKQLLVADPSFVTSFRATYHHAPAAEAIFGYEAMSAVLRVLQQAGASATNRATVVHGFFAIKNQSSPLGTYSINANGDTSIGPFVIERAKASRLVPFKAISCSTSGTCQAQG
jgi:branched-chain amino acid transport system substrate-binding protein